MTFWEMLKSERASWPCLFFLFQHGVGEKIFQTPQEGVVEDLVSELEKGGV